MLKIKDNVDLKELEKFGFIKSDSKFRNYNLYTYNQASYGLNGIQTNDNNRYLYIETYDNCKVGDLLFVLIQAGLVEKIDKE